MKYRTYYFNNNKGKDTTFVSHEIGALAKRLSEEGYEGYVVKREDYKKSDPKDYVKSYVGIPQVKLFTADE